MIRVFKQKVKHTKNAFISLVCYNQNLLVNVKSFPLTAH